MKLLVAGGAGYIGSVVTSMLLDDGHEVLVLDDLSTGHADAVAEGARLTVGSLLSPDTVARALEGIDAVFHFAARSIVPESVSDPALYWRTNVAGTLNLLEGMKAARVSRIVFSSTAAVYGEPDRVPIDEGARTAPTSPYGASKLAVDLMLSGFVAAHQFAATSLRYFNVGGSHGPYGERHPVETHLIPLTLEVAAGRRPAIDIYGTDYSTPDGTAIRDYIHVTDLAEAHLLALARAVHGRHSIYNLGNGQGFSVQQVIDACRTATGRSIAAIERDRRPGDPASLVASSARAARDLGWSPQRDLDGIVGDAWAFAQDRWSKEEAEASSLTR
jgi:UDP-glucose 4-epimerase